MRRRSHCGRARLAALATGALLLGALPACFATSDDVKQLHADVSAMRLERTKADSVTRAQLSQLAASVGVSLGAMNDSLIAVTARLNKLQGDVRGDLYSIGQQLISIQELTGQSQQRLQELRTTLETRNQDVAAAPAAGPPGDGNAIPAGGAPAATAGPGPNQLFQLALEQLRRGSAGTARDGFSDLLSRFPTSDIAPDAQFYLGESLATQGDTAAADSAYTMVVKRFPKSGRAPTALYKHALILQGRGQVAPAKAALSEIVQRYPRSDEAALARDRLRTMK